jgi:hypothetical protein
MSKKESRDKINNRYSEQQNYKTLPSVVLAWDYGFTFEEAKRFLFQKDIEIIIQRSTLIKRIFEYINLSEFTDYFSEEEIRVLLEEVNPKRIRSETRRNTIQSMKEKYKI